MYDWNRPASALYVMAALSGCANATEELDPNSREGQENLVSGVMPATETVVSTSIVDVLPHGDGDDATYPTYTGLNAGLPPDPGPRAVTYIDFRTGVEKQLQVDEAELASVGAILAQRGVAEPSIESIPRDSSNVPKAWSNGIDSRIRLGIEDGYPANHYELAKMGKLESGKNGTGTAFGRRLVFSAAHVLYTNTGQYVAPRYYPRLNGTQHPYGDIAVQAAWVGGYFRSSGCHVASTYTYEKCVQEDWAVLLLPATNTNPTWAGFALKSEAELTGYLVKSYGYPLCGKPLSPTQNGLGCFDLYAYGQLSTCRIYGFDLYRGGFANAFTFSCDTSEGHSGAAIFTRDLGSFHILGEHAWEWYTNSAAPNVGKRIDEWLYNYMLNKRAAYP